MIQKGKNLNKVVEKIMLKIRKDVSYIIQLFYTTYKEASNCKRCYSVDNRHFEF